MTQKKQGSEIRLDGYEDASVKSRKFQQTIAQVVIDPNIGQMRVTNAIKDMLKIRQEDRVNLYYNSKNKSMVIEFTPNGRGAYVNNIISCGVIMKRAVADGCRNDFRTIHEFNVDYVNKRIEFRLD